MTSALGVSVPGGWRLSSLQLTDPSGQAVLDVTVMPALGVNLEEFASARVEEMADRLAEYEPEAMRRPDVVGADVVAQPFSWQPDVGPRLAQTALYSLSGDLACAAVLTAATRPTDEQLDEVAAVVAGLDLEQGSVVRDYSTAELTALAEIAGQPSFPGTGEHAFDDPEAREAAKLALVARGTIRGFDAQGRAHLDPVEAQLVSIPLRRERVLTVERRENDVQSMLLHLSSDVAVAQHASAAGIHRLELIPVALAGVAVGRMTGIEATPPASEEAIVVDRATFDRLRARPNDEPPGSESAERLSALLQSIRRSCLVQAQVHGSAEGEPLTWFDCGKRGLWLAGEDGGNVTARPVSVNELSDRFNLLIAA